MWHVSCFKQKIAAVESAETGDQDVSVHLAKWAVVRCAWLGEGESPVSCSATWPCRDHRQAGRLEHLQRAACWQGFYAAKLRCFQVLLIKSAKLFIILWHRLGRRGTAFTKCSWKLRAWCNQDIRKKLATKQRVNYICLCNFNNALIRSTSRLYLRVSPGSIFSKLSAKYVGFADSYKHDGQPQL